MSNGNLHGPLEEQISSVGRYLRPISPNPLIYNPTTTGRESALCGYRPHYRLRWASDCFISTERVFVNP